MTKTQVCKCNHTKSNHGHGKRDGKQRSNIGKCLFGECDCNKFELDHFIKAGGVSAPDIEPLLSSDYECLGEKKHKRKKDELHIGNLDPRGKPHGF